MLECMASEGDLIVVYASTDSSSNADAAESNGIEQLTVSVGNDIIEPLSSMLTLLSVVWCTIYYTAINCYIYPAKVYTYQMETD